MDVTFICGSCGKESKEAPESNRDGTMLKCPACHIWQYFEGKMIVTGK